MHINHTVFAIVCQAIDGHLHEHREKIGFPLRIVVLYIFGQHPVHIATAHIGWIHYQGGIILVQGKDEFHTGQQCLDIVRTIFCAALCPFLIVVLHHDEELLIHFQVHDAAEGVGILHGLETSGQVLCHHVLIATNEFQTSTL